MPPRVRIERRDPNQAVDPDLGLQQPIRVLAVDLERGGLDSCALAFQPVRHDRLEMI